jgi:hypothetical protein
VFPKSAPIVAMQFILHDEYLVTGNANGVVQVWETATGIPVGGPLFHSGPIEKISSNIGETRIYVNAAGKVSSWDVLIGIQSEADTRALADMISALCGLQQNAFVFHPIPLEQRKALLNQNFSENMVALRNRFQVK